MELQEHITKIGRNMVEFLAQKLQSGDITLIRAKEVAAFYLEHISLAKNKEEIYDAMLTAHEQFPELEPIIRSEKLWRSRSIEKRVQLLDDTL